RTADTHFQFCDVVIPNNRRRGTCPVQNDKQPGIAFTHIEESVSETFFSQLETLRQQSGSQDILIFIHGFNVRLPEAVARAAQVAEDMPFAGPVVVFSWNSQAKTLAYQQDEHSAERHFWSLAELLHGLRTNLAPSCKLHVVAHSMGNRVTLRAINALTGTIDPVGQPTDMFVRARLQSAANVSDDFAAIDSTRTSIVNGTHEIPQRFPIWASWRERNVATAPLANLILAAPDVDAVEFRQLVGDIKHVCSGITVYASESDLALEASRRVHGGRYRAGDARANLDIEGVTVIRVSAPGSNDLLGHSYYGSHPQVLDQLHQLTQPLRRMTLGLSAQRQ
ncbi:MAG: alpha/beta hydrolase, partial [Planctomycetaceae bacterium]|nr:alpha/beta hydrolase [Planctomycetaceae bacterium]